MKDEASRSLIRGFSTLATGNVVDILEGLTDQVSGSLEKQDIPRDQQTITWQADLRYQGQALLLTQDVSPEQLRAEGLDVLQRAFDAEHQQLFSFSLDEEHELVNLRAIARAPRPNITEREWTTDGAPLDQAITGESPIYFNGKDYTATLYDREKLWPGHLIAGPAIVTEMDSTTVVFPGLQAEVDKVGNLLIEPVGRKGEE